MPPAADQALSPGLPQQSPSAPRSFVRPWPFYALRRTWDWGYRALPTFCQAFLFFQHNAVTAQPHRFNRACELHPVVDGLSLFLTIVLNQASQGLLAVFFRTTGPEECVVNALGFFIVRSHALPGLHEAFAFEISDERIAGFAKRGQCPHVPPTALTTPIGGRWVDTDAGA